MRAAMFVLVAGLAFPSAARAADPKGGELPGRTPPAVEVRAAVQEGPGQKEERPPRQVVATSPLVRDVVVTQRYPGQIHARRHIEIKALQEGYLEEIPVREGQAVKQDEVLFRVVPILYKARLEAELAEARIAQLEFENAKKLAGGDRPVVSQQELTLYQAKLAKAQARVKLAEAELNFTVVKAPFDGLLGRLPLARGSLVKKDEVLATLSDNSVMWVYFHVSEARFLDLKARQRKDQNISRLELVDSRIELVLANDTRFDQDPGNTVTVEADFNNETGTIACRADFPNPDRLLRHGQTGSILIHRTVHKAVVIPQRATFEVLDKRYVWVVDQDSVVHARPVVVGHELDDVFVIQKGLKVTDKIVLEGIRLVREGEKVEYEFLKPEAAVGNPKKHAE